MGEGDEKTESATPRRRGDARKRGRVPKSTDLSSIVVLLGMILAVHAFVGAGAGAVRDYAINSFTHLDNVQVTPGTVFSQLGGMLLVVARVVGPILVVAATLGVFVNMAQTGPLWASESLRFDLTRLNPLNGAKRFVSGSSLVNLLKSIYKMLLIGWIAYATIQGSYPQLVLMTRIDISDGIALIGDVVYRMAIRVTVAMLIMASLDYFYQRWSYEKSIKMSKQEVKQETKNAEGNPQIKARIRARQRELAKKRMMDAIPTADVVVTNPTHFAVALKYESDKHAAPVVVAKGADLLAFKIRELAQMSDVPIVENPPLARVLYKQVDIGREVPSDLYNAVAEVLAFVYKVNERRRQRAGYASARA